MLFHFRGEFADRDRPIFVGVHFFEEKFDFVLGDVWVDVP